MTERSGTHKISSIVLRFIQFASAVTVMAILGRFSHLISIPGVYADGRIVYAMVVAGLGIIASIILWVPFDIIFMGFPVDFILAIMWLVAFCLLITVCSSCL